MLKKHRRKLYDIGPDFSKYSMEFIKKFIKVTNFYNGYNKKNETKSNN